MAAKIVRGRENRMKAGTKVINIISAIIFRGGIIILCRNKYDTVDAAVRDSPRSGLVSDWRHGLRAAGIRSGVTSDSARGLQKNRTLLLDKSADIQSSFSYRPETLFQLMLVLLIWKSLETNPQMSNHHRHRVPRPQPVAHFQLILVRKSSEINLQMSNHHCQILFICSSTSNSTSAQNCVEGFGRKYAYIQWRYQRHAHTRYGQLSLFRSSYKITDGKSFSRPNSKAIYIFRGVTEKIFAHMYWQSKTEYWREYAALLWQRLSASVRPLWVFTWKVGLWLRNENSFCSSIPSRLRLRTESTDPDHFPPQVRVLSIFLSSRAAFSWKLLFWLLGFFLHKLRARRLQSRCAIPQDASKATFTAQLEFCLFKLSQPQRRWHLLWYYTCLDRLCGTLTDVALATDFCTYWKKFTWAGI